MQRILIEEHGQLTGVSSDRIIILHIASPNVPFLDLVDMPGIVTAPSGSEVSPKFEGHKTRYNVCIYARLHERRIFIWLRIEVLLLNMAHVTAQGYGNADHGTHKGVPAESARQELSFSRCCESHECPQFVSRHANPARGQPIHKDLWGFHILR